MKNEKRKCLECGKTIVNLSRKQIWCNSKCRYEFNRIKILKRLKEQYQTKVKPLIKRIVERWKKSI